DPDVRGHDPVDDLVDLTGVEQLNRRGRRSPADQPQRGLRRRPSMARHWRQDRHPLYRDRPDLACATSRPQPPPRPRKRGLTDAATRWPGPRWRTWRSHSSAGVAPTAAGYGAARAVL